MSGKAKKEAEDSKIEDVAEIQENQDQIIEEEKVKEAISDADLLILEKDKFLRLFAEFENYKRRTTKERIELYKTDRKSVV